MKHTKKILSVFLALIMIISIVPMSIITASAIETSGTCGENLTWAFDKSTGTLTISGTGAMEDYSSFNTPWEMYRSDAIKNVVIENGVTTIGINAFLECYCLESVQFGDDVTTIGDWAFYRCENIEKIIIPRNITTIGKHAFWLCYDLISFMVDSNNQYYSSDESGVLFNKDKTELIQYPEGNSRTNYTIPDNVTTISEGAFGRCKNLTSVIIPDSVTSIANEAFGYCTMLTSVTIPDSVISIGNNAFYGCTSLTSVTISDSVTSIGEGAFFGCINLVNVYYTGTMEQWYCINIDLYNSDLNHAIIHYHYNSHKYISMITLPTCTEQGYTTYTCECGDSYVGDYVDATGHTFEWVTLSVASCNTNGVMHGYCENCSYFEVKTTPMIKHEYNPVVTAPTCTAQGYTTYTCACGDSYVEDYKDAIGHSYTWDTLTEATCEKDGILLGTCSNCESIEVDYTDATGHNMVNGDCTNCDYTENTENEDNSDNNEVIDPSDNCDCNCHKSGISNFFFKFALFFQRIFGSNKYCSCGVSHY